MSSAEFEMLMVFLGFLTTGCFTLVGLRMLLNYRAKRFQQPGEDSAKLLDAVDDMRRELDGVRNEMADLHERMDFAERLLTRGRDADHAEHG